MERSTRKNTEGVFYNSNAYGSELIIKNSVFENINVKSDYPLIYSSKFNLT